jgi:hypothetical protein
MDKENNYITPCIYMEFIYRMELFAGKCMELEIILLSEISQSQKDKYHILIFRIQI